MCSWRNVHAGDNFDWILGKGTTSSGLTGPSADHTKGNGQGKDLKDLSRAVDKIMNK